MSKWKFINNVSDNRILPMGFHRNRLATIVKFLSLDDSFYVDFLLFDRSQNHIQHLEFIVK